MQIEPALNRILFSVSLCIFFSCLSEMIRRAKGNLLINEQNEEDGVEERDVGQQQAPRVKEEKDAKREACSSDNDNGASWSGSGDDDSSYDSDFEGSGEYHSDVSRTASNTLCAEFSEYVTVSSSLSDYYEFATRLGYTETQVQAVVQKLGYIPHRNDLLAELIKLESAAVACGNVVASGMMVTKNKPGSIYSPLISSYAETDETFSQSCKLKLRPVVIDGSNVAISHGNKEVFSCRGIQLCVDWFRNRGHTEITVFVPKWRKEAPRTDTPIINQEILFELEKERLLVFTPSRELCGKRQVCYDDRYVLKLAAQNDGIVVSNDNYKDLAQSCPQFRAVIEHRILMYSFVNDTFMPPDDPLGRSGPTLEKFLMMPAEHTRGKQASTAGNCPYGKKCTYGSKCKYSHCDEEIERDEEQQGEDVISAKHHLSSRSRVTVKGKSLSLPVQPTGSNSVLKKKNPLCRTRSSCSTGVEGIEHPLTLPPLYVASTAECKDRKTAAPSTSKNINSGYNSRNNKRDVEVNNGHSKLRREFSINPAAGGYDPRLHFYQKRWSPSSFGDQCAGPATKVPLQNHFRVSRIVSAPPAHCHCPSPPFFEPQHFGNTATNSIFSSIGTAYSDSNIFLRAANDNPLRNASTGTTWLSGSAMDSCLGTGNAAATFIQQNDDAAAAVICCGIHCEARKKLFFHLSSLFPQHAVCATMQKYPHETHPHNICAALLSLFPLQS